MDAEVAVVGAGVVGSAVALELGRRGASVALLEAEAEPGLAASGTNSGILHTGFDSAPGELETRLILRAGELRPAVLEALGVPVLECGAELHPRTEADRSTVAALAERAAVNGVRARVRGDGTLELPGESVTDPVAFTLALAGAAEAQGAELRSGARVAAIRSSCEGLEAEDAGGGRFSCRALVNCAGLGADGVARLAGDESFEIYPRKGEFLVFDPPGGHPLGRILLPVPTERTKGVLVFPTLDGKVIAGPTAVDGSDKEDWSVRPEAAGEILPKARAMLPELEGAEPIAAYAGLRPAGRRVNYVVEASRACARLVNVAAIRSTGMTAALGIAEHVAGIVCELGVRLDRESRALVQGTRTGAAGPWWRRTAEYRAQAA